MSKRLSKLAAAMLIYAGFAVYLYHPHFKGFDTPRLRDLFVVQVSLASLGCFVLSRRWVASFCGSLFAGAIYGFGPYMLGLAKFHATAGLLAAGVPWLFCPAAFGPKAKWRWLSRPRRKASYGLVALPFLVILAFFYISVQCRLFAIPTQAKLHLDDLASLLAPLVMAKRGITVVGFYHIPIASLIMGFSILLASRRFGIMTILVLGTILASCHSSFNVSPIIWLAIPVLCCSILIGAGMQGLASAGPADRGWILLPAVISAALAIVTLLLATKYFQIFLGLGAKYARLFVEAAKMYILSTIAVGIIFFMTRAKLRLHWLRWLVLCSATAVDVFLGARFIVDRIF
ncbi:MAG: hypothetical protein ACYSWR_02690 [Planctomycetota bacterium]|jgi:hypothetical protein